MKHNRLISIIMSTYNESELEIKQSIESILKQTWQEFEFIIVHDNPEDKVIETLLYKYQETDNRIKIFQNKTNIGLARSMNFALEQSKGIYIARMDADDISMPERLAKEVEYLEKYSFDMVGAIKIDISETGEELGRQKKYLEKCDIKELLPYMDVIVHPSVLIRRKVLEDLGGYRNFPSAQDYDLWLRMLTAGYKIGVLDEYLIYYRIRQSSISLKNRYRQFLMAEYAKRLYRERKQKNGKDSFSEKSMKSYLEKKCTRRKKERFDKACVCFEKGMKKFKCGQRLKGGGCILKAIMMSKSYADNFFSSLKYCLKKNQLLKKEKNRVAGG